MSHWNYRMCVEEVPDGLGGTEAQYTIREVYYNDAGEVLGWTSDPATFVGSSPGEVYESLNRALGAYLTSGVLDLDTKETIEVSYHGKKK